MTEIILISAVARNNVIGLKGKIPWNISDDMKHFRDTTYGWPVIMGRRTFESLRKPLEGRLNVVVSRSKRFTNSDVHTHTSVEDALDATSDLMNNVPQSKVFVIGGTEIYRQALTKASELILTEIDFDYIGDTYFPHFDKYKYNITRIMDRSNESIPFVINRYRLKS